MPNQSNDLEGAARATPPANGERGARMGYRHQDLVSAAAILKALRDGQLDWIRVGDPEAGILDDVQIGAQRAVHAFQVKWEEYPSGFTFQNLLDILPDLSSSWRTCGSNHPGKSAYAHLVTNRPPSVSPSTTIPSGTTEPSPRHFAGFHAVWGEMGRARVESPAVPPTWVPAFERCASACGMNLTEFLEFVRRCEIHLSTRSPLEADSTATDPQWSSDVLALANLIPSLVVARPRKVEYSRTDLLSLLDWRNRVEFRSRHEFLVDPTCYEPIVSTIDALERALEVCPGGYLGVFGAPGSGKSSLLTETFRRRPDRLVRYYAYIPGAPEVVNERGEATNFLHDVVLGLEREGLLLGESLPSPDRRLLLDRLAGQLQRAHLEWETTGRKTILLIDGLDHVGRELHPERSFLKDLPLPDRIPAGVYLVLGSQTDECLPPTIQATVREENRRIEMAPLSYEAMLRLLQQADLPVALTAEQKQLVCELSGGHPLSFGLLLNHLRMAESSDQVTTILSETARYGGNIVTQYLGHWPAVDEDDEVALLMAHVARLRRPLDFTWIGTWADASALRRLRRRFGHYFRPSGSDTWTFFHPSFREFVLKRSMEVGNGVVDPDLDRRLHAYLADRCAGAPAGSVWRWDELHHRQRAGDDESVLRAATLEFFREQIRSYRPFDEVTADIKMAMRSVRSIGNLQELVHLIVARGELLQRANYFDQVAFANLLLHTGHPKHAMAYVRRGYHLLIKPEEVLRFANALDRSGRSNDANELFAQATPYDLLSGVVEYDDRRDSSDLLETWVTVAPSFRTIQEILLAIRRVRVATQEPFGDATPGEHETLVHGRLLFALAEELIRRRRFTDHAEVAAELVSAGDTLFPYWYWSTFAAWRAANESGLAPIAVDILDRLALHAANLELDDSEKLALAEAYARGRGDTERAGSLLGEIGDPKLPHRVEPNEKGLRAFRPWINGLRLRYFLGERPQIDELLPPAGDNRMIGLRLIGRGLATIARLQALAWRGDRQTWSAMAHEVAPLLVLYNRQWQELHEWEEWFAIEYARSELYEALIDAVALHGPEALLGMAAAFAEEWRRHDKYWPSSLRRTLLRSLLKRGTPKSWIVTQLRELEDVMLDGQDLNGRLEEWGDSARLWIRLGQPEEAERLMTEMIRHSVGVGYRKDYQLGSWIEWLEPVNLVEPGRAPERLGWFAQAIDSLSRSTEGRAAPLAAATLIRIAYRWRPASAVPLIRWFFDQGTLSFESALATLLAECAHDTEVPIESVLHPLDQLLLRISATAHPTIPGELLERAAGASRTTAPTLAARMLRAIDRLALSETRPTYRHELAVRLAKQGVPLTAAGCSPQWLTDPEKSSTTHDGLPLRDGTTLPLADVRARLDSVVALEETRRQESENSFFHWDEALDSLLPTLSIEELDRVVSLFEGHRRFVFVTTAVSLRCADLGDAERAWMYAERAFHESDSGGWSTWWDGGTRIAAARALVQIDRTRARPVLLSSIARDGCDMNILLEVLPLLADSPPYQELWPAVESYCRELFSTVAFGGGPDFSNMPAATGEGALASFLLEQIDSPVRVIRLATQAVCSRFILARSADFATALARHVSSIGLTPGMLDSLEAAARSDPESIAPYRSHLEQSARNGMIPDSIIARRILWLANLPQPAVEPVAEPLPAIYNLALPSGIRPIPAPASGSEPLPDLGDPEDDVRPFNSELEMFADTAGLGRENVIRRAAQLMHEIAPRSKWSADAERALRARLDDIDLHFPFTRPRAHVARQATNRVLQELMAAGHIRMAGETLEHLLRTSDPALMLAGGVQRPTEIRPITVPEWMGEEQRTTWCDGAADALPSAATRLEDGRWLLGEVTRLRHLQWGRPEEERRSTLFPAVDIDGYQSEARLFSNSIDRIVDEYDLVEGGHALLVHNTYRTCDGLAGGWLALNPALASRLKWKRSERGLFAWEDGSGARMVESIWWSDGLIDHQPPKHCEVGEGWLVVATPAAVDQIRSVTGTVLRAVEITRRVTAEHDARDHTFRTIEEA